MVLVTLVVFPALLGVLALFLPGAAARRALLVAGALLQATLVGIVLTGLRLPGAAGPDAGVPASTRPASVAWSNAPPTSSARRAGAPGTARATRPSRAGSTTRASSTIAYPRSAVSSVTLM